MKFNFFLIVFFVGLTGLKSHSMPSQPFPIEGLWLRPCSDGGAQVQKFEGSTSTTTEIFYKDLECSIPLMSFVNTGYIKIQSQQIDFSFENVLIILYSDQLVENFNRRSVCGKSNWQRATTTIITGLRCALFQQTKLVSIPRSGDMRFGIWKLEDQKLYFGKLSNEENGLSIDKRPTIWDLRPYFKQR